MPRLYLLPVLLRFTLRHVPCSAAQEKEERRKTEDSYTPLPQILTAYLSGRSAEAQKAKDERAKGGEEMHIPSVEDSVSHAPDGRVLCVSGFLDCSSVALRRPEAS